MPCSAFVREEQRFDGGQDGCSATDGEVGRGGRRAAATRPNGLPPGCPAVVPSQPPGQRARRARRCGWRSKVEAERVAAVARSPPTES
jgi:hypothetical protein